VNTPPAACHVLCARVLELWRGALSPSAVRKRFKRARELSQASVGLTRYPWTRLTRYQLRTDLSRLRHDLARVVCLRRRLQRLEVLGGLGAHRGIRAGSRRGRARWG